MSRGDSGEGVGFHEELEAINALTRTDFELADDDRFDDEVDAACIAIEHGVESLLARQTPVAGDLRRVLAVFRVNMHLRSVPMPARASGACRMLMVSRCIERIGDHAVDIGEEMVYLVTAELREFTDASHA
jgi:phosphate uptake regulator